MLSWLRAACSPFLVTATFLMALWASGLPPHPPPRPQAQSLQATDQHSPDLAAGAHMTGL